VRDTATVAIEVESNGVTSDDIEWPQPPASRSPYSSKTNISQTWLHTGFSETAELGLVMLGNKHDQTLPTLMYILK